MGRFSPSLMWNWVGPMFSILKRPTFSFFQWPDRLYFKAYPEPTISNLSLVAETCHDIPVTLGSPLCLPTFMRITPLELEKLTRNCPSRDFPHLFLFLIKSPHFSWRHGHLEPTAILSLSCSRMWPHGYALANGKWWTRLSHNALRKKWPPLPFSLAARWVWCLELEQPTWMMWRKPYIEDVRAMS